MGTLCPTSTRTLKRHISGSIQPITTGLVPFERARRVLQHIWNPKHSESWNGYGNKKCNRLVRTWAALSAWVDVKWHWPLKPKLIMLESNLKVRWVRETLLYYPFDFYDNPTNSFWIRAIFRLFFRWHELKRPISAQMRLSCVPCTRFKKL